jgi:Mg-chelatase subunit ChlD
MNDKDANINVYPVADGFIGKVTIDKDEAKLCNVPVIIIIDRSSSMFPNFSILINKVVPYTLICLGYNLSDTIHLITFDSETEYYDVKIKDMIEMNIEARGNTKMAPAIDKLKEILESNTFDNLRIMVIGMFYLDICLLFFI